MTRRDLLPLLPASLASALSSCSSGSFAPASARVTPGIDALAASGFASIRNRRVGLITNQTSLTRSGTPSRLALQRALGRNLTALFTPEHGLDGREPAGLKVPSRRDPLTGLTAWSLYGSTRKPTREMLANVDCLLFDLQDIGARSYTYISTMALAMEACAEHDREFVVLDRPNPLGGLRIDGPPLSPQWKSFVGQIPVPYLHGMTAGELARMGNARGWWQGRPRLRIVPMQGWQRSMTWRDTGLRWIPTSPNIPHPDSPLYYATTGILGGLDGVDIGIGSPHPFEAAAGRNINPQQLASDLNARRFPGVHFQPWTSQRKPDFAGVRLRISPRTSTNLISLAVTLTSEISRRSNQLPLQQTRGDTLALFHKVWGSDRLWHDLRSQIPPDRITASYQNYPAFFQQARQPFLIYS
jgi:uncharacterized protein YbbC (DUF1343 family)